MVDIAVNKKLGELELNVQLSIQKGEFISLYGPSGAGKTSILRMIAGFLQPDSGHIRIHNQTWFEGKINLPPQRRKAGFVFQDYALFPNMTVQENIAFANTAMVDELLQITGLTQLAHKKPPTLSGGQKQRVALARAIALQPPLLLLDEPLSAIDSELRVQLQDTLQQVHQRYGLTTIMVSHDIEEIVKLSDRVIHINNGTATPATLLPLQEGNVVNTRQEGNTTYITIAVNTPAAIKTGDKISIKLK